MTGKGVLLAVIDSGIEASHPFFYAPDGTSRIRVLWDQTMDGTHPNGFEYGTEYSKQIPDCDLTGHGTAVAGCTWQAPECDLLIVKRDRWNEKNCFSPLAEGSCKAWKERMDHNMEHLLNGVEYAIQKAEIYGMPVVVNVSVGYVWGVRDGTTWYEKKLTELSKRWKTVICVGTGNEGKTGGYSTGLFQCDEYTIVPFTVSKYEKVVRMQLWISKWNDVEVEIKNPMGTEVLYEQFRFEEGEHRAILLGFTLDYKETGEGIWNLLLKPRREGLGTYHIWFSSQSTRCVGTQFVFPSEERTLTTPASAAGIVAVGAYDQRNKSIATFSGRYSGVLENVSIQANTLLEKPEIYAPGVFVKTITVSGEYQYVTGTSFATPYVSGIVAQMLEWGIVRENDPFLYGNRVIRYLKKWNHSLTKSWK